jgi:competence protein ComFB
MELRNYMEVVVEKCTNDLLPKSGACDCDKCRLDIMSIALNSLRPHYIVTDTGALYAKMKDFDMQHIVDVTSIVMSAIQKVKEKPQH